MAIDYVESANHSTEVFHDMINKVLELKALDKNTHIPHEWYFINVLTKEIEKNNKLAEQFAMYIAQYYPNYRWINFDITDYIGSVILECGYRAFHFQKNCYLGKDAGTLIDLSQAMAFGEIATDFLIRYCGYSLIKSSSQKIILTSRNDCHKRFEQLLYDGYSLQKRARIVYTNIENLNVDPNQYPGIKGLFYKMPVIPTRDIGYPVDEIIEVTKGKYERVLSKK